jgi:N-acyl amino acid synthase of PEP-CTERM/exosortase system
MGSGPADNHDALARDFSAQKRDGATGTRRLLDVYNSYFETVSAETEEQRKLAFRLRYEVYCVENPFEDPTQNPGEMEIDRHDEHSRHSLLVHRPSGDVVGTVRLVLPFNASRPVPLPIAQVCRHELIARDNPKLPRGKTAEISRFAVSKKVRRRASDYRTSVGGFYSSDDDPRRLIPNISIGLMQSIVDMAERSGITHLAAVMEPTLLRMLARLGIYFEDLGGQVEYHGVRQPCYADLDVLLTRVWFERKDVWEVLTRDGTTWPLNADLVAKLSNRGFADRPQDATLRQLFRVAPATAVG